MSTEIRDVEIVSQVPANHAVAVRASVLLVPVMDVNTAKQRLQEFQEFCAHYLQNSVDGGNDGGDYGVIPGTKKKTLLKSGADKLCEIYGLYDEYVIISSVEDWDKGLFDYTLKCVLKSRRDDSMVGAGVGSCSSFESKYRWRDQKRACPQCGKATIIKGQAQYGGGWICWKKDGRSDGCGAKFSDADKTITDQVQGRVENPDIIDAKNTVLKMAKKRAKIDGVIGVTRSSGIFTQDMEDIPLPPAKPPVQVTEEDIPLTKAAPVKAAKPEPPADQPRNVYEETKKQVAELQVEGKKEDVAYPGCIDKGRRIAFARAWKDALPKALQPKADALRSEWLGRHGYTDESGPTSGKIPTTEFESVKRDAIAFAKGLAV